MIEAGKLLYKEYIKIREKEDNNINEDDKHSHKIGKESNNINKEIKKKKCC